MRTGKLWRARAKTRREALSQTHVPLTTGGLESKATCVRQSLVSGPASSLSTQLIDLTKTLKNGLDDARSLEHAASTVQEKSGPLESQRGRKPIFLLNATEPDVCQHAAVHYQPKCRAATKDAKREAAGSQDFAKGGLNQLEQGLESVSIHFALVLVLAGDLCGILLELLVQTLQESLASICLRAIENQFLTTSWRLRLAGDQDWTQAKQWYLGDTPVNHLNQCRKRRCACLTTEP